MRSGVIYRYACVLVELGMLAPKRLNLLASARRFGGLIAAGLQATIKSIALTPDEKAALTRPYTLVDGDSTFSLITCSAQKHRDCSISLRSFLLFLLQDTQ